MIKLITHSQKSCTRNLQNRNSGNLFPRRHHNNNNSTALHKTTFTLPPTSPLQVLCFGILTQMSIKMYNILRLQQMLLILNSTLYLTITATLLTPAQRYTANKSELSVLVTHTQVSRMQKSRVVFGAKKLHKKKLVQKP